MSIKAPNEIHDLKPLSLRANFVWTFGGNAFAAVSQWAILALLTKTTGDATTGQFVLGFAIGTPLFMFAGLDLRVLQATDGDSRFSFADYRAVRCLAASIALASVPLICWMSGYTSSTFWVVVGVAVGKHAESISDIHYGFLQKSERMDRVSRSLVLHGLASTSALIGVLLVTDSLAGAVWAGSLVRYTVLFGYDMRLIRRFLPIVARDTKLADQINHFDSLSTRTERAARNRWRLVLLGLPLAMKVLMIALIANVTRYFVLASGGLVALGVFGPIAMLMTAGTTVANALNQTVASRLGRQAQKSNREEFLGTIRRLQLFYAGLGAAGILIAWLAGPLILSILFRADFAQQNTLLILVMVATAVQYQGGTLDMALVAERRVRLLAPLSGVTLVVLVLMCWWLVPLLGLTGAGYALAVSRIPRVSALCWMVHFRRPHTNPLSLESRRAA